MRKILAVLWILAVVPAIGIAASSTNITMITDGSSSIVLSMSNGSFDDLNTRLLASLKEP